MRNRTQNIIISISLLITITTIGIIGYAFIENYSFSEAFYMTIITISTVGFQEVHPLSPAGQIFTATLIIFSFGMFAYAITSLTRFMFDGKLRNFYYDYKLRKKIKKINNHVIIVGYGRNGERVAEELEKVNTQFVIIENEIQRIDDLRYLKKRLYIYEHTSIDQALVDAGVLHAKTVISTMPKDSSNLLCIVTARNLNPKLKIISRAVNEHSDIKLRRAGADNVIMSDRMGGSRMAKRILKPYTLDFIDHLLDKNANVSLDKIECGDLKTCYLNKKIRELNIRNITGVNVIGMKRENGSILFNPSPEEFITCFDQLYVIGTDMEINNLKRIIFN